MSWQVLDDQSPTARKRHDCDDCGRIIEAGESYRRVRAITDDGPRVYKCCAHCRSVLAYIWDNDPDARYYYDDGIYLPEYLDEYARDTPLHVAFRDYWRGIDPADIDLDSLSFRPVGAA